MTAADRYRAWLPIWRPQTDLCRRAPHFRGALRGRCQAIHPAEGEPEFDRQRYDADTQAARLAAKHAETVFRRETTGKRRHKGYNRRSYR